MQTHRKRVVGETLLIIALAALALSASAEAKLSGNYAKFAQCPYANPAVLKCVYAVTESGEVVLGSKKVPILNPVILQGGYGEAIEEKEEAEFAKFYAAANGVTVSKAPQNIPGGLLGIVPAASSPPLVKALITLFLENGLTGVNATLELARPVSEIRISENNLAGEIGTALQLPIKVHLENPFLGSSCYVGSSSSPVIWKLTTSTTKPPPPNKPISGFPGELEFLEEGRIAMTHNAKLVDNTWSAPKASGCGGILSFLIAPIINEQLGATGAGHNTAILKSTLNLASAVAIGKNNAENP
jgi:hypothetical protein